MIRITPTPTFKARVRFTQAGADDAVVEIEFRHKAPTALADWWRGASEKPVAVALSEVVLGWSGVIDSDGNEVACNADSLAMFIAGHGPRGGELLGAYLRELTESRQKN